MLMDTPTSLADADAEMREINAASKKFRIGAPLVRDETMDENGASH